MDDDQFVRSWRDVINVISRMDDDQFVKIAKVERPNTWKIVKALA